MRRSLCAPSSFRLGSVLLPSTMRPLDVDLADRPRARGGFFPGAALAACRDRKRRCSPCRKVLSPGLPLITALAFRTQLCRIAGGSPLRGFIRSVGDKRYRRDRGAGSLSNERILLLLLEVHALELLRRMGRGPPEVAILARARVQRDVRFERPCLERPGLRLGRLTTSSLITCSGA